MPLHYGLGIPLRFALPPIFVFVGPPGTGKTMTSSLLGRYTGRRVFRVDLAGVVGKYIGETEKNLGAVFDQAEGTGSVLLLDHADALFGARKPTADGRDRYANALVEYLLLRMERHRGIIVLATNLRSISVNPFAKLRRRLRVVRIP